VFTYETSVGAAVFQWAAAVADAKSGDAYRMPASDESTLAQSAVLESEGLRFAVIQL